MDWIYNRDNLLAAKRKTHRELDLEVRTLRFRLAENEQTLAAIRSGEIDALVVPGKDGDQVYTLKGADHSYRIILEALNEAAVTLTIDGTILYHNSRFSEMTKVRGKRLLGSSFGRLILSAERNEFGNMMRHSSGGPDRREFSMRVADGSLMPVLVSLKSLELEGTAAYCVVITDLTDQKQTEIALQRSEQHYRELFQQGERMRDELQRLSSEIFRVQEEERSRISRDIHDEIGQALTAISLNLRKLRSNGSRSEVKRRILSIQGLVEKTSEFIHNYSRQIHPALLEDLGLFAAIRSFARDFETNTGVHITLKLSGKGGKATTQQEVVVYRVVQESITNVLKHSGAHRAVVMIRRSPKEIMMQVEDNGQGFEVGDVSGLEGKRHGLGILGMRERTRAVGGRFILNSRLGQGTRVRVRIPLRRGGGDDLQK